MTAKRNVEAVLGGNVDAHIARKETRQRSGEELE